MSSKLRRSAYIVSALGVLACAGLPATVLAGPVLSPSLAAPPYTVAATCDLAKPLVLINLTVRNTGDAPTFPMPVSINDAGGAFTGGSMLPRLEPGAQIALQIPLSHPASSPGAVGGNHVVTVAIGPQPMRPLQISVPATLCSGKPPAATPTPAPTPTPAAAPATVTGAHGSRTKRSTPQPAVANIGENASSRAAIVASLKLAVPSNVHSISDHGAECLPHVGLLGALVCPDLVKSGDLLLVWDWRAGDGPDDVDGFHVYRVDGGRKQLTYTRSDKKDLTLADLPKPSDGYARKCYAVSAFVAKQESDLSTPFCASGGSVTSTKLLSADRVRTSKQHSYSGGGGFSKTTSSTFSESGVQVGFDYHSDKGGVGVKDSVRNGISRAGIHFDLANFANRRLVSAKLTLTIASSDGEGNNRSCATNLGTGREFWWLNQNWIDSSFDLPDHAPGADLGLGDAGPQIPVDVTQIVASWLRGNPNYGFVLKSSAENLNSFTNHTCLTTYTNPTLEITYY